MLCFHVHVCRKKYDKTAFDSKTTFDNKVVSVSGKLSNLFLAAAKQKQLQIQSEVVGTSSDDQRSCTVLYTPIRLSEPISCNDAVCQITTSVVHSVMILVLKENQCSESCTLEVLL